MWNKKSAQYIRLLSFFSGIVVVFAVVMFFYSSLPVSAQTTDLGITAVDNSIKLASTDVRIIIVRIINVLLGLLGVTVLGIIIYAGWLWMTAGGNEEQIVTARKWMTNGVIGLVIILSSFAITSFVLNKLKDAIGVNPNVVNENCSDAVYYANHQSECNKNQKTCSDTVYAQEHPLLCVCYENTDSLVVKSITPVTNKLGMNNAAIRVLFNHPLHGDFTMTSTTINSIISDITHDGVSVKDEFTFDVNVFKKTIDNVDEYVGIEAVPTNSPITCQSGVPCLKEGKYEIFVNPNLYSKDNKKITEKLSCGTYPLSAVFHVVSNDQQDILKPDVSVGFENLTGIELSGLPTYHVFGGESYIFMTTSTDDHGIGYGYISLENVKIFVGIEQAFSYFFGPTVERTSEALSTNPYVFAIPIFFPNPVEEEKTYFLKTKVFDVDHNFIEKTIVVKVKPSICKTNPTLSYCGGTEGDSCTTNLDCNPTYKCLTPAPEKLCNGEDDCTCRAWPYIESIEPMNGAVGNFITIRGYHFGENGGQVFFNYDLNGDGVLSTNEKVSADTNLCSDDVWHDSWIIAEVPVQKENTTTAPSISVKKSNGFEDFSNDDFGTKNIGTFVYNNISRPGLCSVRVKQDTIVAKKDGTSVTFSANSSAASSQVPINIVGKGFGTGQGSVVFGTVPAIIDNNGWSSTLIHSVVPFANIGTQTVYVKLPGENGEKSNSVPFEIVDIEKAITPIITSISPTSTTKGSYITISGSNFGVEKGIVRIGGIESTALPEYCDVSWTNDQIIAKVPATITVGEHAVEVVTAQGMGTNNNTMLTVVDGLPRLSICSINPVRGSAPLPSGDYMAISGEYFAEDMSVYFWSKNATTTILNIPFISFVQGMNSFDGWLESGNFSVVSSQRIRTVIPVDQNEGYSMQTGPVIIHDKDSGWLSNPVHYEVTDCREQSSDALPGYQCCSEGPEAGNWKDQKFVCDGTSRDAAYMWRFTSGKIPKQFFVRETCDGIGIPSPTPWEIWKQGKNTCVNALIQTRFSLPINENSIFQNGILKPNALAVFTCGSGDSAICDFTTNTASQFNGTIWGQDSLVLQKKNGENLDANTWYRVALYDSVESQETKTQLGANKTFHEPLKATHPCDTTGDKKLDAAYCFDFKTGASDNICTLVGAGMTPEFYRTELLGIVQDDRFGLMKQLSNIFTLEAVIPLKYHVFGTANQACTILDVDNKPWQWGPVLPVGGGNIPVTADKLVDEKNANSQGYATARRHTPQGAEIFAKINEEIPEDILTINIMGDVFSLATPYTIDNISKNKKEKYWFNSDLIVYNFDFYLDEIPTSTTGFTYDENSQLWRRNRDIFSQKLGGQFLLHNFITEIVSLAGERNYQFRSSYAKFFQGSNLKQELSMVSFPFVSDLIHVGIVVSKNNGFQLTVSSTASDFAQKIITKDIQNFPISDFLFSPSNKEFIIGSDSESSVPYIRVEQFDMEEKRIAETKEIQATSTLQIDLGNPKVINYWPSCIEACINAEIGIEFNQFMATSTYDASDIVLYQCVGESCVEIDNTPISLTKAENNTDTSLRVYPSSNLLPNTWYLVDVSGDIKAIGAITPDGQIALGNSLESKQWKFKTKNSTEACSISHIAVQPDPFVAYFVGQTQQYFSVPQSAPDACNIYGQNLNPWSYGWDWSVMDNTIATTTQFIAPQTLKATCGFNCLPQGSDIVRGDASTDKAISLCGNETVDAGEDCDIAIKGEAVGTSCTLSCLRPGNTNPNTCGNGVVETSLGEECDPTDQNLIDNNLTSYCSATCVWKGSSSIATGDPQAPVCGSGSTTIGEDCDIAKNPFACSQSCLNTGTALAQEWCDTQDLETNKTFNTACINAISVCGNGIVEAGEECEIGKNNINDESVCNERCLLYNINSTSHQQCNPADEGCDSDGTFSGSSIYYSTPSLCSDGVVGTGEYAFESGSTKSGIYGPSCETSGPSLNSDFGQSPVQIVTAVGGVDSGGTVPVDFRSTTIFADAINIATSSMGFEVITPDVSAGEGEYRLQCGYEEYNTVQNSSFNNCPNNTNNILGVGSNTCCMNRPKRTKQYPAVNATDVCRNTYIEVEFDQKMDINSFDGNVTIIQGSTDGTFSCEDKGWEDVSDNVNTSLGLAYHNTGFWSGLWYHVKDFFKNVFAGFVFAGGTEGEASSVSFPAIANTLNESSEDLTWCKTDIGLSSVASYIKPEGASATSTRVALYLNKALEENAYTVVELNGDVDGVQNAGAVVLRNPFDNTDRGDRWIFTTGSEICKISQVLVEPNSHVYHVPNTAFDFKGLVKTNSGGQVISSIPGVYSWEWGWFPYNNPLFDIPTSTAGPDITISSKTVEGYIDAVAKVAVVDDISVDNNQKGKIFSTSFGLTAFFCSNPWPINNDVTISGVNNVNTQYDIFRDTMHHFTTFYCADNNNPLTTNDDLPLFNRIENISLEENVSINDDVINKYILFSDDTTDVIGVQIFDNNPNENGKHRSIREWYVDKFGNEPTALQLTSVEGYETLIGDSAVYINGYVAGLGTSSNIENIVYSFSINDNALSDTRAVFDQLVQNLRLHSNLKELPYCFADSVTVEDTLPPARTASEVTDVNTDVICATDFDCRNIDGLPFDGTNGYCANQKTKLYRDIQRLTQLEVAQTRIDLIFPPVENNTSFPGAVSGAYIPGYTNSHWPISWNRLSADVGGIGNDPVNEWRGCENADPLTCWNAGDAIFQCPDFAQVYEYEYDKDTASYKLHAPFEFVLATDEIFTSHLDSENISTDRWCENTAIVLKAGVCGDGVVNYPDEQCDPVGKIKKEMCGTTAPPSLQFKESTCNDSCQWTVSRACQNFESSCGNGVIETGENCDDGELNGMYGHCAADGEKYLNHEIGCSRISFKAGFCGDGKFDSVHEFCDTISAGNSDTCKYANDTIVSKGVACSIYDVDKTKTCASDCQSYGQYCGDGIVQYDQGEQCDDNNEDNNDFCDNQCQRTALYCKQAVTSVTLSDYNTTDDVQTIIKVGENNEFFGECANFNPTEICSVYGLDSCESYHEILYDGDEAKLACPNANAQNLSDMHAYENYDFKTAQVICNGISPDASNPNTVNPQCGNGVLDQDEQCDEGVNNGNTCNPAYNSSCNYCSASCKVQTVDSPIRCGDGKVDIGFEACDYAIGLDGKQTDIFALDADGNQITKVCSDQNLVNMDNQWIGSLSCDNQCQTLNTSACVQCGATSNGDLGERPYLAVLNPMTGLNYASSWSDTMTVSIVSAHTTEFTSPSNFGLSNFATHPDSQFSYPSYNYSNQNLISNGYIESNALCKDFYQLYFNYDNFYSIGMRSRDNQFAQFGSFFGYPVNGEFAHVKNEVVVSPKVPPKHARVVVKWNKKFGEKNVDFVGGFYSDYTGTVRMIDGYYQTCDTINLVNNYWIPNNNCPKIGNNVIYSHPLFSTEKSKIHSYTLDVFNIDMATLFNQQGTDKYLSIAFFVQAFPGAINQYKNYDLQVEVYLPENSPQYTDLGIKKPDRTFYFKNAEFSQNPLAGYWHVFDFLVVGGAELNFTAGSVQTIKIIDPVTSEMSVLDNGITITNECKIREEMSYTSECPNPASP